jgi:hypothetical protein
MSGAHPEIRDGMACEKESLFPTQILASQLSPGCPRLLPNSEDKGREVSSFKGQTYKFLLNKLSKDDYSNDVDYHLIASIRCDPGIERNYAKFYQSATTSVYTCLSVGKGYSKRIDKALTLQTTNKTSNRPTTS